MTIKLISTATVDTEPPADENSRYHDTSIVVLQYSEDTHGGDIQHYMAYSVFKSALFVQPEKIGQTALGSDTLATYKVTCTYRSPDEEADYMAYGDPSEDFND